MQNGRLINAEGAATGSHSLYSLFQYHKSNHFKIDIIQIDKVHSGFLTAIERKRNLSESKLNLHEFVDMRLRRCVNNFNEVSH